MHRRQAESATMALTDRVFTRLGANDDIMAQKSTFFIELSETAKVRRLLLSLCKFLRQLRVARRFFVEGVPLFAVEACRVHDAVCRFFFFTGLEGSNTSLACDSRRTWPRDFDFRWCRNCDISFVVFDI